MGCHNQRSQEGRCGFPAPVLSSSVGHSTAKGATGRAVGQEMGRLPGRERKMPQTNRNQNSWFKPVVRESTREDSIWGIGKVVFYC